jgi:hypothetical protein
MEGRVKELNILPPEEEPSKLSIAEMMCLPPGRIIRETHLTSYSFSPIDFIQLVTSFLATNVNYIYRIDFLSLTSTI